MSRGPKSGKIYVIDPKDGTRIPFLRGILTRSLQSCGLAFEDAYKLASEIRISMENREEITSQELVDITITHLGKAGFQEAKKKYQICPDYLTPPIVITGRGGDSEPFSKGHLCRSLELCATQNLDIFGIASAIQQLLTRKGQVRMTSLQLAKFVYEHLKANHGKEIAYNYLLWYEFSRSGRPLILLLGGTTGSGKSTIAAELAHRLDIVRTQSTDMLREVMRLLTPGRLVPAIHYSSFNAWRALPERILQNQPSESQVERGYLTQAGQVALGIEGVLNRAVRERISFILEGVHLHPELQAHLAKNLDAVVIPVQLVVTKRKILRKHLKGRGHQVSSRRAERYLAHFEAIWQLQNFFISESENYQIPVILNEDRKETMRSIMDTLLGHLTQICSGNPEKVFAPHFMENRNKETNNK